VVEVSEQLHFTERSQTEHGVVEGSNLLDCHFLAGRLMDGRAVTVSMASSRQGNFILPDNPVCSFTHNILDVVLLGDIEGYLPRAGRRLCARHVCAGRCGWGEFAYLDPSVSKVVTAGEAAGAWARSRAFVNKVSLLLSLSAIVSTAIHALVRGWPVSAVVRSRVS
jgi:hypothetical protein